jgi:hypothetical protein
MGVKLFQQRLAEVHRSHGIPEMCKRDGLEPAACPEIDGNAVVTGREVMDGEKFFVFPDLIVQSPAYPGITPSKKRIIMGLHGIIHKNGPFPAGIRGVLLWK